MLMTLVPSPAPDEFKKVTRKYCIAANDCLYSKPVVQPTTPTSDILAVNVDGMLDKRLQDELFW